MSGTHAGGRLAAKTNKAKYGASFYADIGALGGKKGKTGGFFASRERASRAGTLGGKISRKKNPLSEAERRVIISNHKKEESLNEFYQEDNDHAINLDKPKSNWLQKIVRKI